MKQYQYVVECGMVCLCFNVNDANLYVQETFVCVVTTFHVICSASSMIFHLSLEYSCIDISGITLQHTCEADVRDLRCAGVKK